MDFSDWMEQCYDKPSYQDMWSIILAYYSDLGFTDVISDKDRIEEFSYITQQYRKFVSVNADKLRKCGNDKDAYIATLEDILNKLDEFSDTRKGIVYNFLRNAWIVSTYNVAITYENTEGWEE